MFLSSRKFKLTHLCIMMVQSLINQEHGHFDTVHAAVCVGHDDHGQPLIAHVVGEGYKHEPLANLFKRDGCERNYHVFRSNDIEVANKIGEVAASNELSLEAFKPKWKMTAAFWSVIGSAEAPAEALHYNIKRKTPYFSKSSVCSRFVVQSIKNAISLLTSKESHFPNIPSLCTPKMLEATLFQSSTFSQFCYTGCDPYQAIKETVENQLTRISQQSGKFSLSKHELLKMRYTQMLKIIDETDYSHLSIKEISLAKAKTLLNKLTPILKFNTGLGFVTPTSYKQVKNVARSIGIYERDFGGAKLAFRPGLSR